MEINKFYINGKWVTPNGSEIIDIYNPATEEKVGHVVSGNEDDVNAAVTAANDAFAVAANLSLTERKVVLQEILDGMMERRSDLAQAISEEMGAPLKMAGSAQFGAGTIHFKNTLAVIDDFKFQEIHDNITINKLPIGPVGMITPWNWPLNQMCTKVASAIAAGTSFVIKPSEITPSAAHILAEIVDGTSLPKGIFNLIHGYGHVVGRAMSCHKDLEMISFTGSTRAGIDIQKNAADNIKRVSLELGGKSPNLIMEDVDLEKAIKMGMTQCFFNTGQSCSAPTRMLVPEKLHDQALAIAKTAAESMVTGNPNSEDTFLGPISNITQYEKVQELIATGIEEGAELACGGCGRPEGLAKGFFVKPTVFGNVSNSMRIAQEEIFGPVICLIPYKSLDEAIEIANDTVYGLSSMISCADIAKGQEVAKKIRAGQVILNRISRGDYPAPFGGFKMSGNGREHGTFGIEEYLEVQAVIT
ncbi:MAG: aldehyde dehydrogenase family protein [Proteobacteria bacterium]|nr:aldehyde dehydrogenase family protein [Pseudomonadota bacterium]MDA0900322.1 aldehyde dehydrogenase family protein [Pseudomonadota bacterium]